METKKLSLQEMEMVEGGSWRDDFTNQDISCAATNIAIIAGLASGPVGWFGAGLGIVAGISGGCYRRRTY